MHILYGARGYRVFSRLICFQALGFGGMLAMAAAAPPPAGMLATAAHFLIAAGTMLFLALTWRSLSEAAFCLGLLTWNSYLRRQLFPLLALAPLAFVGQDALRSAGLPGWQASLPLLLIAGLGIASSLHGLSMVRKRARLWAMRREMQLQALDYTTGRHGAEQLRRLEDSLDYHGGLSEHKPFQMRRGLMLADLAPTAWHSSQEFAWVAAFQEAAAEIRAEALNALHGTLDDYRYPDAVQGSWNVFWLLGENGPTPEAEARCPATIRALRQVDGFPCMREAHFSILQPHSRILPHCDDSNTWVTAHFGISIPLECGIRVGRETRRWQEGEFLFFDTSFEHEAWNHSDAPRIVLLFDFLHPRLNPAERDFHMHLHSLQG